MIKIILIFFFIVIENLSAETLKFYASSIDKYIGTAVAYTQLYNEEIYRNILSKEFNMIVPENAMKFGPIHPERYTYNFNQADFIVQFATSNFMAIRGHCLVWHNQNPSWLVNGNFTRDEMITILQEHITTVVSRYKDVITAWDVVNEAIDDSTYQLRNTIWYQKIGPEYIDLAFQFAHEADPDCLLFYNDYSADGINNKSNAIYNMVKSMIERGIPIHGVGLQMHISLAYHPSENDVYNNIARFSALGLITHITEMDVSISNGSGTEEERLLAQAQIYRDITTAFTSSTGCPAMLTWGFTDKYTWLGSEEKPLLFDINYSTKPCYNAVIDVLKTSTKPVTETPLLSISPEFINFPDITPDKTVTEYLTITNTGNGVLTGQISTDSNWILISSSSFLLSGGENFIINVIVDGEFFFKNPGTYSGNISVKSNGGDKEIPVSIKVTCILIRPNPFEPEKSQLEFYGDGIVPLNTEIVIYNIYGEKIKILNADRSGNIIWDGKDENGKPVISGIYIYTYKSPIETGTGKITILHKM